ncbi:unnamed protein product [Clonostachys byssicola]|uniref:Isotrichodermin C-15 hydroxylase n=1 Tax=Clonostachys byssicola TaxID=160290 RepID=A0A9N9UEK5_9HYPO|nr:unnamed protein product [Clonostachys byssicola]
MAPPWLTEFATPRIRPSVALLLFLGGLVIIYVAFILIYNVFFHPLRKFPGPKLWAATLFPWIKSFISGNMHNKSLELHNKYGPIVRTGPNELSFASPESWQAVMGHRKPGQPENGKASYYGASNPNSMVFTDRENHARMRRIVSHGFSASSMLKQQPVIKLYVDKFIQQLYNNCQDGNAKLNVCAWFNHVTFDIIGDLSFGESFGCLETGRMHPWVGMIFATVKVNAMRMALSRVQILRPFLTLMIPSDLIKKVIEHKELTKEKVRKRLGQDPRPDFFQAMVSPKGDLTMNRDELDANVETLVIAGSETTATALSGASYHLTTNPRVLKKLANEIRCSYTSEDEIDLLTSAKLPYLNAVVEEVLRMYPPAPNALPRETPPQGDVILGETIPGNTVLGCAHYVMYHSESNFKRAMDFVPERFMGDPEFENDRRDCLQPFNVGPRNCLGKNLAYAEMRMILARLVWNFDMSLDEESKNWLHAKDHRGFLVWAKPELYIHFTPRKRE